MIRFANDGDKAALKRIWQRGFNDADGTIDAFFDRGKELFRCLVYCDGDTPIAAMYLFDCGLKCGDSLYKSAYLYALSTLPEYRGKGVMTELIQYALDFLEKNGYEYAFLSPSENSLVAYYERLGFSQCDMKKCADIPVDCIFDMPTETAVLSAGELYACRNRADNLVCFDTDYIGFMLDFGEAAAICFDGGYALCDSDGDTTRVIEFDGEINRVLSAVKCRYKSESYRVYLQNDALMGEAVCRGMMKPLCGNEIKNSVHIGLVMD